MPLAGSVRSNSAHQLIAQTLLLLIGVLTAPYFFTRLGADLYGLVILVGLTTNYFAFTELGLGQAAIRLIAEALGTGDRARGGVVVGTAALSALLLGLMGAGVLIAVIPLLTRVFAVSAASPGLVRGAFALGALSLFLSLQISVASAPLRALERFDLVSRLTVWTALLQALGAVLALHFGHSLIGVLSAGLAAQTAGLLAFWTLNGRIFEPTPKPTWDWTVCRDLLRFGVPVTFSQVAAPALVHGEKVLIGALLDVGRVPYYSVPFSFVWALTAVPASIGSVVFPRFARQTAAGDLGAAQALAARANRVSFAALVPVVLICGTYAREILETWMGPSFGRSGAESLRILALALLVNVAAWPVYNLLQASGRPEVPARLHLIELLFHIPLCALLIRWLDITGAALAWLVRVAFDTLALMWASKRSLHTDLTKETLAAARRPLVASLLLLAPALAPKLFLPSLSRTEAGLLLLVTGAAYCTVCLLAGLSATERTLVLRVAREFAQVNPRSPGAP